MRFIINLIEINYIGVGGGGFTGERLSCLLSSYPEIVMQKLTPPPPPPPQPPGLIKKNISWNSRNNNMAMALLEGGGGARMTLINMINSSTNQFLIFSCPIQSNEIPFFGNNNNNNNNNQNQITIRISGWDRWMRRVLTFFCFTGVSSVDGAGEGLGWVLPPAVARGPPTPAHASPMSTDTQTHNDTRTRT